MEKNTMKNRIQSLLCILVAAVMLTVTGCGSKNLPVDENIADTSRYLLQEVDSPTVSSVGGEWSVIAIMNSQIEDETKEAYALRYFDSVRAQVKSKKGILDEEHYTEYARVSMGVASIGEDPTNVEGYNLISYLDDYEKIREQGVNAAAYALVASQMCGVKLANEEKYIQYILDELKGYDVTVDGMSDYVSMGVLALSYYKDRDEINNVIEEKIEELSKAQLEDGSMGNCESTSEAIIALTTAGVDVTADERFIKNEKSLLNGLLTYKKDSGYFHVTGDENYEEINIMATEKALLALESIKAFDNGTCLYKSKR